MKYLIISTLLLVFTSCATGASISKSTTKDNKPVIPSAISSSSNIEISQIGF